MFRNRFKQHFHKDKGQALIGVLAVIAISTVLASSLMINSLISAHSSLKLRQSNVTLDNADSYIQDAIIKIIRDPSYIGESLTLPGSRVIIEVTGENPKDVLVKSINSEGDILRRLSLQVNFSDDGVISVSNWVEN